ncbi:hypothetical protein [Microbacterium maritypicum]
MLDAAELEELRSLQARAYGREASLTDADAVRLRELEGRRVKPAPAPAPAPAPEDQDAADPDATPLTARAAAAEDGELGAGGGAGGAEPPVSSPLRAHRRLLTLAAVAVLVVGLGVGWLAFGRAGVVSVELTAQQQDWQSALVESGEYDAGSVRALAVEEGAVIWTATKEERERTCLILRAGDVVVPSCERTVAVEEAGLYGVVNVRGSADTQRQVAAQMLFAPSGEPAVAVTTYDRDTGLGGITYADEEESRIAERLVGEGFQGDSLWVVGYDGDVPVWTATRLESQNQCLIHGGSTPDSPMICADPETMQDQASSLVLNIADVDTGDVTHLELASSQRPSFLVITREGGVTGAGGG